MSTAIKAYVEHVALRVHDLPWHVHFFGDVLGMTIRDVEGDANSPRQVWTFGGLQFIATPGFAAPPSNDAGWLAHIGIMVDDLEAALARAQKWKVQTLPQGRNWLQLPDGLAVEFLEASAGAVAQALAVNPRA